MEKKHIPHGPYEKYFKRPIDFCCGLAAVVVFCWLYVIIAIFVRIKLGSPVLFTQERPGKDGKNFKMYKFRTMSNATDEHGQLLPDIERLTKFGRFLEGISSGIRWNSESNSSIASSSPCGHAERTGLKRIF